MYILQGNEATYFEGDSLKTVKQLPAGAWGIAYKPMVNTPYFYRMNDYKTSHGKIYGKSEKIAKHVIEAYKGETDKNLGALFSGKKGLGKSLTIRLIVEELIKTQPVVVVDQYTNILPSVLGDLHDAVIVLDEFEKLTRNANGEGGMTPQESLLSILDGTKSLTHNLYLLSVNDAYALDDNLISRPGRIRYHYRYNNIDKDVIREYCNDTLCKERLGEIDDVIEAVKCSSVTSLDIIQSLVKEMNAFKDMPLPEIMECMNIGDAKFEVDVKFICSLDGHDFVVEDTWTSSKSGILSGWCDDTFAVKIRLPKDGVGYLAKVLTAENFHIDKWNSFYPNVDPNDPFWKSIEDSDGDIYIQQGSDLQKRIEVKLCSVQRHSDFGAF